MNLNTIIKGNSLDVLKQYPNNSIDLMVTDPPYGYSFMGKDWDKTLPDINIFKECFRVLKAGSFAFVMSAPRQDVMSRMMILLEDAGFDIGFTSIYWTYACLSEDTEVLTADGWERFNKSNNFINKAILCYDVAEDRYLFEIPSQWHSYQIKDTLYRIKSDSTDQLVTRNHRVLIEREGELLFQFAEKLGQTISVPYLESLPMLQETISDISGVVKENTNFRYILLNQLQTEGKHQEIPSNIRQTHSFNVRSPKTEAKRKYDGFQESGLERWSDVLQNSWQLCRSKIHPLPEGISVNGSERRICDGTSDISSSTDRQTIIENGSSPSHRSQSSEQQFGESGIICEQSSPQETRTWASYRTTLATVTSQEYNGLVFCPTVSTGCFVARRNGKIFLTGNSGFPKAANVGKLVDKRGYENERYSELSSELCNYLKSSRENLGLSQKDIAKHFPSKSGGLTGCVWNWENGANIPTMEQWQKLKELLKLDNAKFIELIERAILKREEAEREVIARQKMTFGIGGSSARMGDEKVIDIPATPQAKALDGSYAGFQPKPAVEVIIVAMKPLSEKTYVDQALENGKGITWFDSKTLYTIIDYNELIGLKNALRDTT